MIYKKEEDILSLIFIICLFIPHINFFFLLVPVLSCFYLKLKFKKTRNNNKINIVFFIILLMCVTFLLNINRINATKPILEFLNVVFLFLMFPFVGNVKLKNEYLYLSIFIILFTQFSFVLNFSPVVNFINAYYPYNEIYDNYYAHMQQNISMANSLSFRIGGIFRNENQCAKYVTLLLSVFLIENFRSNNKKNYIFVLLCFIAISLTGSRTGFAVASAMILYRFFINSSISKQLKLQVALFSFVFLSVLLTFNIVDFDDFRILQIKEGFSNSANTKLAVLLQYISIENSFVKFALGNLSSSFFHSDIIDTFDSEYGEFIYDYGFIGFIFLIIFYIEIFYKLKKEKRIICIFLLWSISSTIILSYKTSFLFMLLISKYYSESISNNRCQYSKIKSC